MPRVIKDLLVTMLAKFVSVRSQSGGHVPQVCSVMSLLRECWASFRGTVMFSENELASPFWSKKINKQSVICFFYLFLVKFKNIRAFLEHQQSTSSCMLPTLSIFNPMCIFCAIGNNLLAAAAPCFHVKQQQLLALHSCIGSFCCDLFRY